MLLCNTHTLKSRSFSAALALIALICASAAPAAAATNTTGGVQAPSGSQATAAQAKTQSTKIAPFHTYGECLTSLSKVSSVSALKAAINKRSDTRQNSLDKMLTTTAKIKIADDSAALKQGINSDKAYVKQVSDAAAKQTDAPGLRVAYCQIIYRQVYDFRARQVHYMSGIDTSRYRDHQFLDILNRPANTNVKSLLKTDIDQRYERARYLLSLNVGIEDPAAKSVMAATTSNYTNNLVQPTLGYVDLNRNFIQARQAYTEALVLKQAAKSYKKFQSITLNSVTLADKDGKAVDHSGSAYRATVVVTAKGQKYTTKLQRSDNAYSSVWKTVQTVKS